MALTGIAGITPKGGDAMVLFTFEDMMLFGAFLIALLAYLNDRNNKRK